MSSLEAKRHWPTKDLSAGERDACSVILKKDQLRSFLRDNSLQDCETTYDWLAYIGGIKSSIGNINKDLGFVATLLAKAYLKQRFGITSFDAAGKPQGASGIDIEAATKDGRTVVGELKTTKPYQPNFGAAQKATIKKDLDRLATSTADFRFMFVIDRDSFYALCRPTLASRAPGIEIVDLVTGETFCAPRVAQ